MEDPVVLPERNLYGHLVAGILWDSQFDEVLFEYGWEKVSNEELFTCHASKTTILIRICGQYQIGRQDRKHTTKSTLTWENQHQFPTMKIWVVLEECQISKVHVVKRTSKTCSKQEFPLEPKKNYLQELQENLMQKSFLLGRTTWKVVQRNVWKDIENSLQFSHNMF